jgi:hypothetical protein
MIISSIKRILYNEKTYFFKYFCFVVYRRVYKSSIWKKTIQLFSLLSDSDSIEYFRDEWLSLYNAWYKGVWYFTASGATNKVIKDGNIFWERIILSRFQVLAFEMVQNKCAKSYIKGLKQYHRIYRYIDINESS